ncbi:uncharacterized protein C8R40DRAFT_1065883 [Lentinula edodes]|uniref:uncharacterized protein n=1 Tax=Lentinula edodes TaxID=5353 RepID=UPI001E8E92FE|nr:uncharacterized protein C8R40DRAFT_1065883 [Lentinula edodes]KAH7879651.1 hypothetical protein C8R40DRAFT_1065883 [Lentinula edodes]
MELKFALPLCLLLSSATAEQFDELNDKTFGNLNGKLWKEWCTAVLVASSSDLRYIEFKREEVWSAIFCPNGDFSRNPRTTNRPMLKLIDYRPPHRSLDLSRLRTFRPMGFCFIQIYAFKSGCEKSLLNTFPLPFEEKEIVRRRRYDFEIEKTSDSNFYAENRSNEDQSDRKHHNESDDEFVSDETQVTMIVSGVHTNIVRSDDDFLKVKEVNILRPADVFGVAELGNDISNTVREGRYYSRSLRKKDFVFNSYREEQKEGGRMNMALTSQKRRTKKRKATLGIDFALEDLPE